MTVLKILSRTAVSRIGLPRDVLVEEEVSGCLRISKISIISCHQPHVVNQVCKGRPSDYRQSLEKT